MKKFIAVLLASALVFACAGCGSKGRDTDAKSEGVMTYDE